MQHSFLAVLNEALKQLEYVQVQSRRQSASQTASDVNQIIRQLKAVFLENGIDSTELEQVQFRSIEEQTEALKIIIVSVQKRMGSQATMTKIPSIDPELCFVIMSFNDKDSNHNNSYKYGIRNVVEDCGYRCERTLDQDYNSSIYDQILLNIQKARFIVGNLTHARPNCYYEVGYAHAIGKEVILVARDNDLDIHFDVKHFNIIIYNSDIEVLEASLKRRIEGTVGSRKKP